MPAISSVVIKLNLKYPTLLLRNVPKLTHNLCFQFLLDITFRSLSCLWKFKITVMQSFEGWAKCAIGNVKVVTTHKKVFFFFSCYWEYTGEDEPKVDTNNPLIELFQGKIVQMCSWVHKATGTLGLRKILWLCRVLYILSWICDFKAGRWEELPLSS